MTRAAGGQHEAEGDRLWRPFAYVVGEMSPREAADFEDLLAESQEAREAVAEAVLLVEATRRAEREARTIPFGGHRRRAWAGVAALLAAACLLVAWVRTGEKREGVAIAQAESEAEGRGVALAWSELREADGSRPADLAWLDDPSEGRGVARAIEEEAGLPSWLLLAASPEAGGQATDEQEAGGLLQ
jgi:hypothetical protein